MVGINPSAAASAYSNSQGITGGIGKVTDLSGAIKGAENNDSVINADGNSFADLIKQGAEQSIQTMKAGEQMSAKAVAGQADVTDVVQAITSAELTLQTVTAVRDKVIAAYQDVMRMPI
ncbi:MAG: flagellar hook-basal body complex protein FliE [Alphaproteobacteria bacterium]